jgi:hypothetical protein
MGFPKMIYRGGKDLADARTVADEAQQKAAEADGYLELDMDAFMAAKGATPAPKAAKGATPAPKAAKGAKTGNDLV